MTVIVRGSGAKVVLRDKDFVAKGGEKSIYRQGDTAYCIYHDPAKAIPIAKIKELAALSMPEIICPTTELLDSHKQHCGEVMPFVTNSWAPKDKSIKPLVLCQLFTNAFRRRHGVTHDHDARITDRMLAVMAHCHSKTIYMVDPNETNWLVTPTLDGVHLVDTSCFKTPSFHGTAIKPAIQDWHSPEFGAESDRFSMAVVLGWLWVGAHPYLTYHPDWEQCAGNDALEPRMRGNVSFFDPRTEFNAACRPIAEIPGALRAWLEAVLQRGLRVPPPLHCGDPVAVIVTSAQPQLAVKGLQVTDVAEYDYDIVGVYGQTVVTADNPRVVVNTPVYNTAIAATIAREAISLRTEATGASIALSAAAERVFALGDRLYVANRQAICEVRFYETSWHSIHATVLQVGAVADLPSLRFFDGCVMQNVLGRHILSVFPSAGQCLQYQLRELDGWQLMDAKYEGGVFAVMCESGGVYRLLVYRLHDGQQSVEQISDQYGDVTFCVTGRGMCVLLAPDGYLHAFPASPGNQPAIRIRCPFPDATLYSDGASVLAAVGKKLYKLSFKR